MKNTNVSSDDKRFFWVLAAVTLFGLLAFIGMIVTALNSNLHTDKFFDCCDWLITLCIGAIVGLLGGAISMSKKKDPPSE